MSEFKFPYTCPGIDYEIRILEDAVKDVLRDVMTDVAPLTDVVKMEEMIDNNWDDLKTGILDSFEKVRSQNEDIRDAAEVQISDKVDDISRLEEEISGLYSEIDKLKDS